MKSKLSALSIFVILSFMGGCANKAQETQSSTASQPQTSAAQPVTKLPVMMGQDMHGGMGNTTNVVHQPTPVDNVLAWNVPAGWQEKHGTGMRLVSFKSVDHPDDIDAYIVILGGISGSVDANIYRWAGQISIVMDEVQEGKFVKDAQTLPTKLGSEAKIFDFTTLQGGQPQSIDSMITAMISLDEVTVFVKMTGTIDAVTKNKDKFKALVGSIYKKTN